MSLVRLLNNYNVASWTEAALHDGMLGEHSEAYVLQDAPPWIRHRRFPFHCGTLAEFTDRVRAPLRNAVGGANDEYRHDVVG